MFTHLHAKEKVIKIEKPEVKMKVILNLLKQGCCYMLMK